MIRFTLSFSAIAVVIKRFGCLLLALPFFILLIGCDSASSTTSATDNSTATESSSISSAQNIDRQSTEEAPQNSNENNTVSGSEMSDVDEGQSLIAAAKPDKDAHAQRTSMISGTNNDSNLQATLMGDYGGMLPCSSCDNIDLTLNLFADGSVLKTSIYKNSETPKVPLVEPGIYRQDSNTIIIVYENENIETYLIQNNHLIMLDKDKNPDADYTLWRK